MPGNEILYDDAAMEEAHSILVNANTKLIKANENYPSDKLSGKSLIVECENAINEIQSQVASALQALLGTNSASTNIESELDFQGDTEVKIIETFDVNSKSQAMSLQQKLQDAGYDIGSAGVDGDIGKCTIGAINLWAKYNGYEPIESKNDITDEIYNMIINSTETREMAAIRYAEELIKSLTDKFNSGEANDDEIRELCKNKLWLLGYYNFGSDDLNFAITEFCRLNGIDAKTMGVSSKNITDDFLNLLLNSDSEYKKYDDAIAERVQQVKDTPSLFDPTDESYIIDVQSHLKKLGYYSGDINGKYNEKTEKAVKDLLDDIGLSKLDFSNMDAETYKYVLQTKEKGLEVFERKDPSDNSFIGAAKDLSRYYATHAFKYDKGVTHEIIPSKQPKTYNKEDHCTAYRTDCSTFVTATLYYYAEANGSETMMKEFSSQKSSDVYVDIVENDGYENGVKYFDAVSLDELEEGDILVKDGHVEIYAGSMSSDNSPYANVYNCGSTAAIEEEGATESTHQLNQYMKNALRPILPEKVKEIDG